MKDIKAVKVIGYIDMLAKQRSKCSKKYGWMELLEYCRQIQSILLFMWLIGAIDRNEYKTYLRKYKVRNVDLKNYIVMEDNLYEIMADNWNSGFYKLKKGNGGFGVMGILGIVPEIKRWLYRSTLFYWLFVYFMIFFFRGGYYSLNLCSFKNHKYKFNITIRKTSREKGRLYE